jgi:antitoxin component YwqK of YwqJK toxin-antitoxin module
MKKKYLFLFLAIIFLSFNSFAQRTKKLKGWTDFASDNPTLIDPTLEKKLIDIFNKTNRTNIKGVGYKAVKLVFEFPDWKVERDDAGRITSKYQIADAACKLEDGSCGFAYIYFQQDFDGTSYGAIFVHRAEDNAIDCSTMPADAQGSSAPNSSNSSTENNSSNTKAKEPENEIISINTNSPAKDSKNSSSSEKYPNGSSKSSGSTNKDGKKTGTWKYFTQTGEVSMEENYNSKGELNGKVLQYNKGSVQYETNYSDGKKNGRYAKYKPDGSLIEEGNYKNGTKDGEWKTFDGTGKVKETKKFKDGMPQQ